MPELELSVMLHTQQTESVLRSMLNEFEAQSGVKVNLRVFPWPIAHAELNKIALYHHGPDVSEIGSTWVSDLIAMNALRPFSRAESDKIGRPEDFIGEAWKSGHLTGDPTLWSIPWLAETYAIHYRRDLLAQAGIAESAAFQSHQAIAHTARALQQSGVQVPVELTLKQDAFGMLHTLASWVWAAGGDFCSMDGKRVLFSEPEFIGAVRDYFRLLQQLTPEARKIVRERKTMLFEHGGSAVTFGTLIFHQNRENAVPEVRENWAAAVLPGQRFMGGSNLVVWKHTRNEEAALELVQFLTGPRVQSSGPLQLAALSPRATELSTPQVTRNPVYRVMAESICSGRSYNPVPLWGLIEDRLVGTLVQIGMALLSEEDVNLDKLVQHSMESLARKLNITLAQ